MWRKCKHAWLYFIVIFLCECQKRDLGVDLLFEGERLVVYSELIPDKPVSLYLNQTYPPTGKFTFKNGVAGAEISLMENGIFKSRLTYRDSGTYISSYQPIAGKSYSFIINHTRFPSAFTEQVKVPLKPIVTKITLQNELLNSINDGEKLRKIEVKWQNEPQRKAEYLVKITGEYKKDFLAINVFNIDKDSETEDPCSFNRSSNRFVFNSACFSEQEISTSFGAADYGFLQNPNVRDLRRDVDAYNVVIASISESYTQFLKEEIQPSDIFLAFQIPKTRYSNVQGGYGIVIASNSFEKLLLK
jgi:hypothetical protein